MATVTVALLQLESRGSELDRAVRDGEDACKRAAAMGADIALFPEMWQIGYAPAPSDPVQRSEWQALATDADGEYVGRFRELARELGIAIVATYLERSDGAPRNAATLIDRRGELLLSYAKVHTCDFGFEDALTPGDGFPVARLETDGATLNVGMMICFDREAPEAARLLMLGGAELVLVPNSCVLDAERIGQFRARAFENMMGVAMANYATPDPPPADDPGACNGHSVAFSGVCYDERGNTLDHKLVEGGEGEEIALATFDIDAMREYRSREPWGDAYRKPDSYARLLGESADPVFRREDSRRHPSAG